MLPADVETLMPRQTGAVPENHRAATTGSMSLHGDHHQLHRARPAHGHRHRTVATVLRERVRLASVDRGTRERRCRYVDGGLVAIEREAGIAATLAVAAQQQSLRIS